MDHGKVGKLIQSLRREKGLTQQQLADLLHVSNKAVSKWERGLGCPDVSLLESLCNAFDVQMRNLLQGNLAPNETDGGNLRNLHFYVCPICANMLTATGDAEVSCCGRRLFPLEAVPADADHMLEIIEVENDWYVTFTHVMHKQHYIGFVACVASDKVLFVRLYPEQGSELRIPMLSGHAVFYCYCSEHGLWCIP